MNAYVSKGSISRLGVKYFKEEIELKLAWRVEKPLFYEESRFFYDC